MDDDDLRLLDDHYDGELVDRHAVADLCQCVSSDASHPPLARATSLVLGWFPYFSPSCFRRLSTGPDVAAIAVSHRSSCSYAAFRHAEMETVSITRRAAIYMEWVGAEPVRPPFNLLALPCDALAFALARISITLGLGRPPTEEELGQVGLLSAAN